MALPVCAVVLGSTIAGEKGAEADAGEPAKAGVAPAGVASRPDEIGMGATQRYETRVRCALSLLHPASRVYELSQLRSGGMPVSPFGAAVDYDYHPSGGLPFTRHAFNGETMCGDVGSQGTQIDALGHFGVIDTVWDPATPFPTESIRYFGGLTQADVKPAADSPLLRLGIEKAPPIVTSAVLLDARTYLGQGDRLSDGQLITAADIQGMLVAQGLGHRGLLPGDVLYIYTGWEDLWLDPDVLGEYYAKGPGLAVDAAFFLEEQQIVAVGLDVPFMDPVKEGQLQGQAPPQPDAPPGLPFFIHHYNLTQAGIYQIENAHLEELAADEVWTSCTMILPLLERGAAGSAVRPIAVGTPRR
ncbi:MAG TPA: cyclase family protein [Polyangiaceae bacterium]|nr:cyclase family protein [Polyangiaceae bacterium]